MNIVFSKDKFKTTLLLIILYCLLIINYRFVISESFEYMGFSNTGFSNLKFLIVSIYTLVLILLVNFIKNPFYNLVFIITIILLYSGQAIYYLFNTSDFLLLIYMSVPSLLVFILDKVAPNIKLKRKVFNLNNKYERLIFIVLFLSLILPYFKYAGTLNIKNLLFIDIYDTRLKIREFESGVLGYLTSPLSRVVLPFLMLYAFIKRKKLLFLITFFSLILLFLLTGAVKSIFVGIFCALFFVWGNYEKKAKNFIVLFLTLNIFAITTFKLFNSIIINDYLRRILYVPANLFHIYYDYFNNNFTYFKHSKIYSLITNSENGKSVSMFIGENILGKEGLNANVGIFVEGFFSFGLLGIFISGTVFILFIYYMGLLHINHRFFGLIFVYIYIINTAFIETLMLTHGLLFFIVFSYFFLPSNKLESS